MRLKLKNRRIALAVLALLVLAVPVRNHIRDRDIPSDMPSAVRKQVRRLRSPWTHIRWKALVALRGMGEKAAPAAPYVIRMLGWENLLRGEAQDTLVAFGVRRRSPAAPTPSCYAGFGSPAYPGRSPR